MFDWPWLERFRKEGFLDLYRCQLAEDLQEMGHLNREAMFWVVSLMLANSSGSLCVPVLPETRSRLEQVLQGALPGPELQDWLQELQRLLQPLSIELIYRNPQRL